PERCPGAPGPGRAPPQNRGCPAGGRGPKTPGAGRPLGTAGQTTGLTGSRPRVVALTTSRKIATTRFNAGVTPRNVLRVCGTTPHVSLVSERLALPCGGELLPFDWPELPHYGKGEVPLP